MGTPTTRKRILEAAQRLFNEHGTAAVSTNHIAAEASISSGNLYYHYHNKEEIIRALVEEMIEGYSVAWRLPPERQLCLEDLLALVSANFEMQWRYRFLSREAVALIRHDPILAQQLRVNYQQRMLQQKAFVQHLIDAGVLRPMRSEGELDEILAACWVIVDHWLLFLEATGQPVTYEQFQLGTQVIARVIHPYVLEQ